MIFLYVYINRTNNIEVVSMYMKTLKSNIKYDVSIKLIPGIYGTLHKFSNMIGKEILYANCVCDLSNTAAIHFPHRLGQDNINKGSLPKKIRICTSLLQMLFFNKINLINE